MKLNEILKVTQGSFDPFYWEVETKHGLIIIRGAYSREEAIESAKEFIERSSKC